MRREEILGLPTAIAVVLASLSITGLTTDRSWIWAGALLSTGIIGLASLLRRLDLPALVVHLAQVALLGGVLALTGVWATPEGGSTASRFWNLALDGVLHIQTSSAPMPPHPGVSWLVLFLIGLVTIIADILVVTLASPSWVIAPLLTLYLIPALALPDDIGWGSFLALGVGYLIVLVADGIVSTHAWSRNLASDSAARPAPARAAWPLAAAIGVPVLIGSVVIGTLLPDLGDLRFTSGRPNGAGPLQMEDPTIQLNRNLNLPVDRVVLTYTSDRPQGEYLRLASLPVLDSEGWKPTSVTLRTGDMPAPPGLEDPGIRTTTRVQVGDFGNEYLPAPYAAQSFDAPGDWSWDPVSLMIISTARRDRVDATRDLEYSVESVVSEPEGADFVNAPAGSPVDRALTTFLPAELPESIVDLTHQVTAKEPTAVLKAAAIQAYLNDPTRFTYDQTAPSGDGFEVLVNFLTNERHGYCIHFAAAMAVMARIEGIPSRVSVGFLPGTKVGDRWEVRAHNMHAWPELYFSGYGWVRFEPTSAVAAPPAWTVKTDVPEPAASPTPTPTPSASAPRPSTSAVPQVPDQQIDAGFTESSTLPWGRVLVGLLIALGVGLVAAGPMLLRDGIRRRRLGAHDDPHVAIADAWTEVRDSVHDLGRDWPRGTPREVAERVASGLDDEGADAIRRLGAWVERSRYARALPDAPATLAADVALARRSLVVDQPRGTVLLARFAPRSLLVNLSGAVATAWAGATEGVRIRRRLSAAAETSEMVTVEREPQGE